MKKKPKAMPRKVVSNPVFLERVRLHARASEKGMLEVRANCEKRDVEVWERDGAIIFSLCTVRATQLAKSLCSAAARLEVLGAPSETV